MEVTMGRNREITTKDKEEIAKFKTFLTDVHQDPNGTLMKP